MSFNMVNRNLTQDITPEKLETIPNKVLDTIKDINNDNIAQGEIHFDTVAVGVLENGQIVVAANTRERRLGRINDKYTTKIKLNKQHYSIKYVSFGLKDSGFIQMIASTIRDIIFYKNLNLKLVIVEETMEENNLEEENIQMKKSYLHNSKHAELKILKYALDCNEVLRVVGASKAPCKFCHPVLMQHGVRISSIVGNNKVSNFKPIKDSDFTIQVVYQEE